MYVRLSMGIVFMALAIAAVGCSVPAARNGLPIAHNAPPAQMLMHPGPGVGGPGPGVIPNMMPPGVMDYAAAPPTVQVQFKSPGGMEIRWDVSGVNAFDSEPLTVPGTQNFPEGGIYRLKLTGIEGHDDQKLYPTLEISPTTVRTAAYLAHTPIPVQFTQQDFDQAFSGNFVTKVIYIPDPEFQELAIGGVDTLVSTRLDPGVDPIVEADRRGAILAILRVGSKDLELNGGEGTAATQASFQQQMGPAGAGFSAVPFHGGGAVPYPVSGVTAPMYGMPITGTPIGLPGPPHIPLGVPAGLQSHTIHNHTAMHIPGPTPAMTMHVKQDPGLSYPRPADTVRVREQTIRPQHFNLQPPADMVHGYPPGQYCPPGQ